MEITEDTLNPYMEICKDVARNGSGLVRKPFVGAILVDGGGKVFSRGYKRKVDGTRMLIHAERDAINSSARDPKGSTLVTSLEPCWKNEVDKKYVFSPCCKFIVESGIKRVVFGDYDNIYNGKGIRYLKNKGVEVIQVPINFAGLGRNYSTNYSNLGQDFS